MWRKRLFLNMKLQQQLNNYWIITLEELIYRSYKIPLSDEICVEFWKINTTINKDLSRDKSLYSPKFIEFINLTKQKAYGNRR